MIYILGTPLWREAGDQDSSSTLHTGSINLHNKNMSSLIKNISPHLQKGLFWGVLIKVSHQLMKMDYNWD